MTEEAEKEKKKRRVIRARIESWREGNKKVGRCLDEHKVPSCATGYKTEEGLKNRRRGSM